MEEIEADAKVRTNIKPVIGVCRIDNKQAESSRTNAELDNFVILLSQTLVEYIVIPYIGPSAISLTQDSTHSTRSSKPLILNIEWIEKYLQLPAMVILVSTFTAQETIDQTQCQQFNKILNDCNERSQRLVILLYTPEGLSHEHKERISKLSQVPVNCIFNIVDPVQGFSVLLAYLAGQRDKFYREKSKKYKKKFLMSEETGALPIFAYLRYQFKLAYMDLFLNDSNSALRNFNAAYTAVIEHYKKLNRIEDQTLFLDSTRWLCDVISYRIALILTEKGEKVDADGYIAGHVQWFSTCHANESAMLMWKCKIYDAMAQLTQLNDSIGKKSLKDPFHAGYYLFLAAKQLITLESINFDKKLVNVIVNYLIQAYDIYQRLDFTRFTLYLGRLIASQYLIIGDNEQASLALEKLRKAYRSERWSNLTVDLLMELITLAKRNGNYKMAIECYWEYANIRPFEVLDSFEEEMIMLCSNENLVLSTDRVTLDMSMMGPTKLLRCSCRFIESTLPANQIAMIEVVICNMSPLPMVISSILIKFTDNTFLTIDMDVVQEVVPGAFTKFYGKLEPMHTVQYSIESITLDLNELPIRICFDTNSLTKSDLIVCNVGWNDITTNWKYIKSLSDQFTDTALTVSFIPLLPKLQLTVKEPSLLIQDHPCPITLSLFNDSIDIVNIKVCFSGNIQEVTIYSLTNDQTIIDDNLIKNNDDSLIKNNDDSLIKNNDNSLISLPNNSDNVQSLNLNNNRLSDLVLEMSCEPQTKLIRIVNIVHTMNYPLSLRIDSYCSFIKKSRKVNITTNNEKDSLGQLLSSETVTNSIDLSIPVTNPLEIVCECVQLPTEFALGASPLVELGLVQYHVFITVTCNVQDVCIQNWSLSLLKDNVEPTIFTCLYPPPPSSSSSSLNNKERICLKLGESYRFLFKVCRIVNHNDPLYQPLLKIDYTIPSYTSSLQLRYKTSILSMQPASLFVVQKPVTEQNVGHAIQHQWLLWNSSEESAELVLKVESCEDYVYMGTKQRQVHLMPGTFASMDGIIIPLKPGIARPPQLVVKSLRVGEAIHCEALTMPPIHVLS